MVDVRSFVDGEITSLPLFDIAKKLPAQLNKSDFELGNLKDVVKQANGMNAFKIFRLGDMQPYAFLTLPHILQVAYNYLPDAKQYPKVEFMAMAQIHYPNNKVENRIISQDVCQTEESKKSLIDLSKQPGVKFALFIAVASPENEINLPANQMNQIIQDCHDTMFDTDLYQDGHYKTRFQKKSEAHLPERKTKKMYLHGGAIKMGEYPMVDALLPALGRVYGGRVRTKEQKDGQYLFVPAGLYEMMMKEEKPDQFFDRFGSL